MSVDAIDYGGHTASAERLLGPPAVKGLATW